MTIILTNGKTLRPAGKVNFEPGIGVRMENGYITHILPYSQIAHIIEGRDAQEEEAVYKLLTRSDKPIGNIDLMNSEEIIKQFYGD